MDSEGGSVNRPDTHNHQRKKRKKTTYSKINNQIRQRLIEMIYMENYPLKEASQILKINYSTAKTILRIFRIEKRVEKKNAEEERELKKLLAEIKESKEKEEIRAGIPQKDLNGTQFKPVQADIEQEEQIKMLTSSIGSILSTLKTCFDDVKMNQSILERLFWYLENLLGNYSKIDLYEKLESPIQ